MPERVGEKSDDREEERDREVGFTLIELMVAMGIFMILISILLIATSQLARGAVRVQVTAQSTSEVLLVFQNLDRQVRYSDAINAPGSGASGDRYVEFRVPAASSASGLVTCVQWRFRPVDGTVQTRRWTDGSTVAPTAWSTRLSNVVDTGAADYPFARDLTLPRQQLHLELDTGTAAVDSGTAIDTSFVARNSSSAAGTAVCSLVGGRP